MAQYPKTAYQTLTEIENARRVVGNRAQQEANRVKETAGLRKSSTDLLQSGTMKSALPIIGDRMSVADIARAQTQINGLQGLSISQARDPRLIPAMTSMVGERTGQPIPVPVGASAPPSAMDRLPSPAIRGSTSAEITSAAAGGPTGAALVAQNATNDAISGARGTGTAVATPYGTVSSTVAKPGAVEAPAVVSDTGVVRGQNPDGRDWERALVRQYPQLGVAGSKEHDAFVDAFKKRQADGGTDFKPEMHGPDLARELFNKAPADTIAGYTQSTSPIVAPAVAPSGTIAGYDQSSAPTAVPPVNTIAPTAGAQAAADIRSGVGSAYTRSNDAIRSVIGNVVDFARGLTGSKAQPYTPPASPLGMAARGAASVLAPGVPFSGFDAPAPKPSIAGLPSLAYPSDLEPPAASTLPAPSADNPPALPPVDASKPMASNGPAFSGFQDADTKAFAQNPQDDQFRKKLREASQLSYS